MLDGLDTWKNLLSKETFRPCYLSPALLPKCLTASLLLTLKDPFQLNAICESLTLEQLVKPVSANVHSI